MELTFLFFLLFTGFTTWILTQIIFSFLKQIHVWNPKKLPPGPFPLPIIGNLHSLGLGKMPHKSSTEIAKRYGDMVSLKLGSITTIVVSSPSLAQEILREHDAVLAYRQIRQTTTSNNQHLHSVVWIPPGPKWRHLRKIGTSNLFSISRLDAGRDLRRKKVEELLSHLEECSKTSAAVNISQVVFSTSLNILSNTIFSMDLADLRSGSSDTGHELKGLFSTASAIAGTPNIADFFPVLGPIDPQGIRRRSRALKKRIFHVFDGVIDERMRFKKQNSDVSNSNEDVLDVLISIHEENPDFELMDMRSFLFDMFIAGTETTSTTIEWTMSELIRNPTKLTKLQAELDQVIGKGNPINDTDVLKLPYLRAVIKETLRLHPPVPFLVPRRASVEVKLSNDYVIPKDAQVWINLWAMGRDEKVWKNAKLFEPERFLNSPEIDYKGQNYELLPFGSGRRVCLGIQFADRVLHLVMGSMISCFDWEVVGGEKREVDMEEMFGFSLAKAQPLCVVPIRRIADKNTST